MEYKTAVQSPRSEKRNLQDGSIHIATAANNIYAPHVGAMLHSLFSANLDEFFDVHFLHGSNFPDDSLGKLGALCKKFNHRFHSVLVDSRLFENFPKSQRYVEEAWYRVRLPSILRDVNKLLWLDADTIIVGSVSELWRKDLGGYHLAAVRNAIYPEDELTLRSLGLINTRNYFNSGVMILDLAAMRASEAERVMISVVERLFSNIKYADQDVINVAYADRFLPLELQWNLIAGAYFNIKESIHVHGYDVYRKALSSPRIVHFTGLKPWLWSSYHPYRNTYLSHRNSAGWGYPESRFDFVVSFQRLMPIKFRIMLMKLFKLRFREFFLSMCLKY